MFKIMIAAAFGLVLSSFAALADVGPVEGRHGPGTRQTTFEPVYGAARAQDVFNRLQRLKAAGVHPPTAEQYAKAVAAIQQWCGANCQPSPAVRAWIAEGVPAAARTRAAPVQRTQAAPAPQRQVVRHQPQKQVVRRLPPPPVAVYAPAPRGNGVTVICGTCNFR